MIRKILLYISVLLSTIIIFNACSNDEHSANEDEKINEQIPDYSAGKLVYQKNCLTCHLESGEGILGAFPGLVGKAADINTVVNGVEGSVMIAFKDLLTDQEITDVINYINHTWGNAFIEISSEDIKVLR